MKILCLLISLWLTYKFAADAERRPANCGDTSFMKLYPNPPHEPEDRWSTNYHGLLFVVEFNIHINEVIWTVTYKTKSSNQQQTYEHKYDKFEDKTLTWSNQEDNSDSIFRTTLQYTNPEITTELYIKPGSELAEMKLLFSASDERYFQSKYESCSIENIKFQECKTEWPLLVNSTSSKYSSKGKFFCAEGFDLFPLKQTTQTECMSNSHWEHEEGFQCYQAPNDTRLIGNVEIKEHGTMEIYCNFTQTTPHADRSIFSFGGNSSVLVVNNSFTRNIAIEDDGKEIWCQPLSNYTDVELFAQKGKSPTRKLRVLFAPKAINIKEKFDCNWTIGDVNSCDFTFQSRLSADNDHLFVGLFVGNKTDTEVEFKFSISSNGDNKTISINEIEKSELSTQRFLLVVVSSQFHDHFFTIPFDLIVITRNHDEVIKSRDETLMYNLIGSGGILIILLVSLVVVWKRRQSKNISAVDKTSSLKM